MAKVPPCPEKTLKTLLPQQSSTSSRDGKDQWISVEHRRRRRVAFDEVAKRMLRYPEDSEDLKVASLNCKNSWKYRKKHYASCPAEDF